MTARREVGYITFSDFKDVSDYLTKYPELTPLNVETQKDAHGNDCYCLWFWEVRHAP